MKGKTIVAAVLLLAVLLCGCGQSAAPAATPGPTPAALPSLAPTPTPAPSSTDAASVDVDLTLLSSTMVYSEVYNMIYETESYLGKSVKMRGLYNRFESNGTVYHACVVQDATACCAQGLEFELADGAEYPENGQEITVQGVFDLYQEEENGNFYAYIILRDARLLS